MRQFAPICMTLFAIACSAGLGHATSITVPVDYATVQEAFDTLNESPVDTIFIQAGVVEDSIFTYELNNQTVIGLGDSLTRPVLGPLVFAEHANFVNLRFTGTVKTLTKARLTFRDCRFDDGFETHINGSPRTVSMVNCRVTGRVIAVSDVGMTVDNCWFDRGSLEIYYDTRLTVSNTTFTGPGGVGIMASYDEAFAHAFGCTFRDLDVAFQGSGSIHASDNVIEDCGTGASVTGEGAAFVRNRVMRCGTGFDVRAPLALSDNVITDCVDDGVRFMASDLSGSVIERNVIARSGRYGALIQRSQNHMYSPLTVRNNTSYSNGFSGFAVVLNGTSADPDLVTHNIAYRNGGHGLVTLGSVNPTLSCNDWFGNDSSAVAGMPQSPDDLEINPQFCDVDSDNVTLFAESPLAEAPGCGLIGARGVGCQKTATMGDPHIALSRITNISPNPIGGAGRIEYAIARAGHVLLTIVDIAGRRVATLLNSEMNPGRYSASWSAAGDSRSLRPGTYFVRLATVDRSVAQKIVVLR